MTSSCDSFAKYVAERHAHDPRFPVSEISRHPFCVVILWSRVVALRRFKWTGRCSFAACVSSRLVDRSIARREKNRIPPSRARGEIQFLVLLFRLDDGLKIVPLLGNMSDGVDGGGGENEVDSHSSTQAEAGNSSNHREEEALDPDNEAALNTNYDSSDGAVPAFR